MTAHTDADVLEQANPTQTEVFNLFLAQDFLPTPEHCFLVEDEICVRYVYNNKLLWVFITEEGEVYFFAHSDNLNFIKLYTPANALQQLYALIKENK